jgi:hypothetical protein
MTPPPQKYTFMIYTLAKVFALYNTITKHPHLKDFAFILEWHSLTESDKLAKYSQFACHELNFFIFKKDKPFFQNVIKPFLIHKKDVSTTRILSSFGK